jgi:hypothetical protein
MADKKQNHKIYFKSTKIDMPAALAGNFPAGFPDLVR